MQTLFEAPVDELDAFEAPEEEVDAFEAPQDEWEVGADEPVSPPTDSGQSRLANIPGQIAKGFTEFAGPAISAIGRGAKRFYESPLGYVGGAALKLADLAIPDEALEKATGSKTLIDIPAKLYQEAGKALPEKAAEAIPFNPAYSEEWMAGRVPQIAGQIAGVLTSLATTRGAGSGALVPRLAQAIDLSPMFLVGSENGYEEADRQGVTDQAKRDAMALSYGLAEAAVESIGGFGTTTFGKRVLGDALKQTGEGAIRRLGKTVLSEAAEEPITGQAQDIAANVFGGGPLAPPPSMDLSDPAVIKRRLEEAAGGAIGGTMFAGVDAVLKAAQAPGVPPDAAQVPKTFEERVADIQGRVQQAKPSLVPEVSQENAAVGNTATAAALQNLKARTDAQKQQALQEEQANALQVQGPAGVLPREQGEAGERGGERQGVEPVQQGLIPPVEGGANLADVPAQQEQVDPFQDETLNAPPAQTPIQQTPAEEAGLPALDEAALPVLPEPAGAPVAGVEPEIPLDQRLATLETESSTPEGIAARQQRDTALVESLNAQIAGQPGIKGAQVKLAAPQKVPKEFARFRNLFESLFNHQIVLVEPAKKGERGWHGVRFGENNTVFINADSEVSSMAVLGHEFAHSLQQQHPDLYNELVSTIDRLKIFSEEQINQYGKDSLKVYGTAEWKGEVINNLIGDRFFAGEVFDKLAKEDPNLFLRLARALREWIANVRNKLRGVRGYDMSQRMGLDEKNLAALDDELVRAMGIAAKSAQQEQRPETEKGDVTFFSEQQHSVETQESEKPARRNYVEMSDEDLAAAYHKYRNAYYQNKSPILDKRIESIGAELAYRSGLPDGVKWGSRGDRVSEEKGEPKFSVTPEQSEAFARHAELEAKHNAGTITPEEVKEAEGIVAEAAKRAGYDIGPMHHGTKDEFTSFEKSKIKGRFPYSFGFHFTSRRREAEIYAAGIERHHESERFKSPLILRDGENVVSAYIKADNPLTIQTSHLTASMHADIERASIIKAIVDSRDTGTPYDAVVIERTRGDEWDGSNVIVFDPSQIKSALPFTGVPLAQRFNPESLDIRYSASSTLPNTPQIKRAVAKHGQARVQEVWNELQSDMELMDSENRRLQDAMEGDEPTKATKDERTYAHSGEAVEFVRPPISDATSKLTAQRILENTAWLSGGYSKRFGKSVMKYLAAEGSLPGVHDNLYLRARLALDVLKDDALKTQLGLNGKTLEKQASTIGTLLGRGLRQFRDLYDPLQTLKEEARSDTEKEMKKQGIEDAQEFADSVNEEVEKGQKELVKSKLKTVMPDVVQQAKADVEDAGWFEGAMGAFDATRRKMLEAIKKNLKRISALRARLSKPSFSVTGAGSEAQPEDIDKMTVEQAQAELDALVAETSDMIDAWFARPKRKKKATPEQVEIEAKEAIETQEKVEAESLTFTEWASGQSQQNLDDFDDVVIEHLNANGFEREAFADSLRDKFENVDPAFIESVTNRVADLLDGKETEADSKPDYDARAKRIVARAVAEDSMPAPEPKQVDALTALIKKRLSKQIGEMEFITEAKKLGIEAQSAFALNRKIERDQEGRTKRRTVEALQQEAAKLRGKAIESALKKLKKRPTPNLPKSNRFVEALLHSLKAGILDDQTVRDAFAVAYDLHGLTSERLEVLGKLIRDIEALPDGMPRQTLMENALDVINDLAPSATVMNALYNNLMGGVLGAASTMLAQFSGGVRVLNPLQGAFQFLTMADPKALRNPINFFKVWGRYMTEAWKSANMVRSGIEGIIEGQTYGLGVSPSRISEARADQMKIGRLKPSELWKMRIGRQSWLRTMLASQPQSRAAQLAKNAILFPSWMASRSFNLIRGAEAWSGNIDKQMAFRALAIRKLTDDGMKFQEAWNKVNDWLSPKSNKQMWEEAQKQAKEEIGKKLVSPIAIKQRAEEIVQDKLDEQHKLNMRNRQREMSAWMNFKAEPLTKLGAWFSEDVMGRAPTAAKMLFLFSRFFSNIYERALFNSPLGFIHMSEARAGEGAHTLREKRIEAIFGSLEQYRQYRNGLATASFASTFMAGTMMALAWAMWKWLDEDDEGKPPPFWITGDLPPSSPYATERQLESAGWWSPSTLYLRLPGTDQTLKINYVQANPEMAITLSAIGNIADRIMFPELLTTKTNKQTGEREKSAFKMMVQPVMNALAAPASRSTYVTFQQAIQRTAEGNPQSLAKLLGRPIGETVAATVIGGPIARDIAKAAKPDVPRAAQSWEQAFASGIPFAHAMGMDTGLPMVNQWGSNIENFPAIPWFSSQQQSTESVKKASKLLNDVGITKEGPQEMMLDSDVVAVAHDGKQYHLTLDERRSVLSEIGKEFASNLNDRDPIIRAMELDQAKKEIQRQQEKARNKVLRNWRDKIREKS